MQGLLLPRDLTVTRSDSPCVCLTAVVSQLGAEKSPVTHGKYYLLPLLLQPPNQDDLHAAPEHSGILPVSSATLTSDRLSWGSK